MFTVAQKLLSLMSENYSWEHELSEYLLLHFLLFLQCFVCFVFETGSYNVGWPRTHEENHNGLEPEIIPLPQPPEYWN